MKHILLCLAIGLIATLPACTSGDSVTNPIAALKKSKQSKNEMLDTMVKEIDYQMFVDKIYDFEKNPNKWQFKGEKPVVVDFYASWCGPCKKLAPIMAELAEEYEGRVEFYKADTDAADKLAATFNISSIPALLFIPADGREPSMSIGLIPKSELKKVIEDLLPKK